MELINSSDDTAVRCYVDAVGPHEALVLYPNFGTIGVCDTDRVVFEVGDIHVALSVCSNAITGGLGSKGFNRVDERLGVQSLVRKRCCWQAVKCAGMYCRKIDPLILCIYCDGI